MNCARWNRSWDSAENGEMSDSVELIPYSYYNTHFIYPGELLAGFILQLFNLYILSGRGFHNMAYRTYLTALSCIYLVSIPFMAASVIYRGDRFPMVGHWLPAVYFTYLDSYIVNVVLCAGNVILVILAFDSLRGLLNPFSSQDKNNAIFIIGNVLLLIIMFLLPLTLEHQLVKMDQGTKFVYCRLQWSHWMHEYIHLMHVLTVAFFEIGLTLVVILIYVLIFCTFINSIQEVVNRRKAVTLCLGVVSAYLVCNIPSAIKQIIYATCYIMNGSTGLNMFRKTEAAQLLVELANGALLLNTSLSMIMQYFTSKSYKKQVHRVIRKVLSKLGYKNSDLVTPRLRRITDFASANRSTFGRCPNSEFSSGGAKISTVVRVPNNLMVDHITSQHIDQTYL